MAHGLEVVDEPFEIDGEDVGGFVDVVDHGDDVGDGGGAGGVVLGVEGAVVFLLCGGCEGGEGCLGCVPGFGGELEFVVVGDEASAVLGGLYAVG